MAQVCPFSAEVVSPASPSRHLSTIDLSAHTDSVGKSSPAISWSPTHRTGGNHHVIRATNGVRRALVAATAAALTVGGFTVVATPAAAAAPVTINLLDINDFHGRIDANTVKWAGTIEQL